MRGQQLLTVCLKNGQMAVAAAGSHPVRGFFFGGTILDFSAMAAGLGAVSAGIGSILAGGKLT